MSLTTSSTLKGLETQRNKLQVERKLLNNEIAAKQLLASTLKKNITHYQQMIKKLSFINNDIVITEHAIIRYITRVMGINIEDIKQKILPADKLAEVKAMGNCTYSLGEHKITVKDNVVVTVIDI